MRLLLSLGHPVASDFVRFVARANQLAVTASQTASIATGVHTDLVCVCLDHHIHALSAHPSTLPAFRTRVGQSLRILRPTAMITDLCIVFTHPLQNQRYLRLLSDSSGRPGKLDREWDKKTRNFAPLYNQGEIVESVLNNIGWIDKDGVREEKKTQRTCRLLFGSNPESKESD